MVNLMKKFFESWRFPVFTLSTLLFYCAALIALLALPASEGELGNIARYLKVLCFNYNEQAGTLNSSYLAAFFIGPALLTGMIVSLWWKSLREVRGAGTRAVVPYVGSAFVLTAVASISLLLLVSSPAAAFSDGVNQEFPRDSLRTSHPAPEIELVSHRGEAFKLSDYRGQVIMLTGLYARCNKT